MKKNELIKASGAISIPHKVGLLEAQLWNILLKNAFPDLIKKDVFEMSMKEVYSYWPYERHDDNRFKKAIENLMTTIVGYNIFEKDKEVEWGRYVMLAGTTINKGICRFSFDAQLKQLLNNPTVYTKINLLIQQCFSSKYSLALYELCIDYEKHGTPVMSLDDFKEYMGVEPHEYPRIYDLKKWAINDPIKEINEKSDIIVSYKTQKTSRKISHIRFFVERKENKPSENPKIEESPVSDSENNFLQDIKSFGISEKDANEIIDKYPEEKIKEKIILMVNHKTEVKNPAGFLKKAILEDWKTLEQKEKAQKEAKKREEKEKQKQEWLLLSYDDKLKKCLSYIRNTATYGLLKKPDKERVKELIVQEVINKEVPFNEVEIDVKDICNSIFQEAREK